MKEILFSLTKKDFDITYFSGTGAGGQHRNKHMNCVRVKHRESGIMSVCQDQKSLERNKRKAFERLCKDKNFQQWLKIKTSRLAVESDEYPNVEDKIQAMLSPVHLKIEVKDGEGEWVEVENEKNKKE